MIGNRKRLFRIAGAILLLVGLGYGCGGGVNPTTPPPPAPRPPRALTAITIEPNQFAVPVRVGQEFGPLVAYGQYDDGTSGTVAATWSSSDPGVAAVAEDGAVTGIGAGEATISASFEGLTATVDIEVAEPLERNLVDRPDDISGPQIHVVYAVPSDVEDQRLDVFGNIATSFEAIQGWLTSTVGRRLRLDTYRGELDVTFLRLPFTHQEGDGAGGGLVAEIADVIDATIGYRHPKTYAIYYAGRAIGVNGSAYFGGPGAVYLGREGNNPPGLDPSVVSHPEVVMVHELFHIFRAVPDCAPNHIEGSHVEDHPNDVMYAGVERGLRDAEAVIDLGRDDYFEHGRSDCLDIADSPYWEPVPAAARGTGIVTVEVSGEWPIRCDFAH